jgi:hypothetical protein
MTPIQEPSLLINDALDRLCTGLNSLLTESDGDKRIDRSYFTSILVTYFKPSGICDSGILIMTLGTDDESGPSELTVHHYALNPLLMVYEFDTDYIILDYQRDQPARLLRFPPTVDEGESY